MKLGLGLSLCSVRGASAPVFDPATLALSGWWRADYAASPWAGNASAGASNGRSLAEATNPPAAGSAVGGKVPADFDGTNDLLTAAGTAGDYYTAAAYSGWALINVDSVATDSATPYLNDCILTSSANAWHGVSLRSSGSVLAFSYDTGSGLIEGPSTAFTIGAWQLVQWKFDGTNLKIRVNGGAWQSLARSNLSASFSSESLKVMFNINTAGYADGKILDFALAAVALSDGNFDDVLSYARSRYGLALS